MLQIALDKVAHIILLSREYDAKVDAWDEPDSIDRDDRDVDTVLEDLPGDGNRAELQDFLQSMNEDELASLVALAWIGRETYAAEELSEAMSVARSEVGVNAPSYLLNLPLLPDYLGDGLDRLGIALEELESEAVQSKARDELQEFQVVSGETK
jgi:hypothetical protein